MYLFVLTLIVIPVLIPSFRDHQFCYSQYTGVGGGVIVGIRRSVFDLPSDAESHLRRIWHSETFTTNNNSLSSTPLMGNFCEQKKKNSKKCMYFFNWWQRLGYLARHWKIFQWNCTLFSILITNQFALSSPPPPKKNCINYFLSI